jgi:adenylylsulfate kinase
MKTKVLWFTGLSGSGKTTIAELVKYKLKNNGNTVQVLDGDEIRRTIHTSLKFTPEDIKKNNKLVSIICKENLGKYDFILVPIISPLRKIREITRKFLYPSYIEIYIKTELEECIKRDVKGLYKKALSGQMKNFIGISPNVPYEEPNNPEIIIETSELNKNQAAKIILNYLKVE